MSFLIDIVSLVTSWSFVLLTFVLLIIRMSNNIREAERRGEAIEKVNRYAVPAMATIILILYSISLLYLNFIVTRTLDLSVLVITPSYIPVKLVLIDLILSCITAFMIVFFIYRFTVWRDCKRVTSGN